MKELELTIQIDGDTGFRMTLSDGSILTCPGDASFDGPLAEFLRRIGADPIRDDVS